MAKSYDGASVLARHIKAMFDAGSPVYLGVIQPTDGRSIQVNPTLSYWTIDVAYELLGNIPTADVTAATLGGTAITTTVNRIIDGSSTTLRYKIGDTVLATANLGTGTSHSYTPPASAGAHFPDSLTGVLTIEAETTLNGEACGTISASVELNLPDDAAPACTAELTRIWAGDVPAASKIAAYVQAKSGASFALSGEAKYGASVAGYALSIEGKTYSGANVAHAAFAGSGSIAYTYAVTDSRGLSRTYSGSIPVLAWSPPKVQSFTVVRVTDEGAEAIDGTYAKGTVKASVSSLTVDGAEKNALTFSIRYREIAEDGAAENAWTSSDALRGSSVSGTFAGLLMKDGAAVGGGGTDASGNNLPFNDMCGYEFQLVLSDIFAQSTANDQMPTKVTHWDVDESTGKMGFGGDAPGESEAAGYRFYRPVDARAGLDAAVKKHVFADSDFSEYFQQNTTDFKLTICRFGPVVVIGGAFSVKKAPSSSSQVLCLTLPDWAVPMTCIDAMQFGNGTFHWRARAHMDGHLYARKYLTSNGSASTPAAGESYNLSMSWIAADAQEV